MKHKTVAQRFIDEINLTRAKLIQIFDRAIFEELRPNTAFKEEFTNQSFKSFITQLVDKKHISSFSQIYDMIIGQINWACESSLGPLAQCDSELYWSNYTLPNDFMNQFKQNGMLSTYFEYPENRGELSIYKPIIWKNKGLTASIVKILNELPEIKSIQDEIQKHVQENVLVPDHNEEQENDLVIIHNEEQEKSLMDELISDIQTEKEKNDDPELSERIDEMLLNIESISPSPIKSSANSEAKAQNVKELEWIKSILQLHTKQIEDINSKQEVLESSFSAQQNNALQDYYKGFINEFSKAFTSAQAVLGGQLKIEGTKAISVKLTSQLAKFIPLLGDGISSAIQEGANYKVNVEEQHKCLNISKFGITNANLERLSKYIAKSIASDPKMKGFIENYNPTEAAGFFNKIGKVANKVKNDFDNKLDKLNTVLSPQELLGHEHAAQILKDYISNGSFKDSTLDEIVNLFISVILPENIQEENANIPPLQFIQQDEEEKNQDEDDDFNVSKVVNQIQVEQELTPRKKAMLEKIAMLEELLAQKDNSIQKLQNAQLLTINTDVISRSEVEEIIATNQIVIREKDEQMQKMSEDFIIVQQESFTQNQIIRDQDNVNQEQKSELSKAHKTITKKDKIILNKNQIILDKDHTIVKQEKTIEDLQSDKLYFKKQTEKLELKVEKFEKLDEEKTEKINKLKNKVSELQSFNKSHNNTVIINLSDVNDSDILDMNKNHINEFEQQMMGQNSGADQINDL